MEGNDNNSKGSSWGLTARNWIGIIGLIFAIIPFAMRSCGVKPTRTELPPVNVGFNSNAEAQQASNAAKQLANLIALSNALAQNANRDHPKSNRKTITRP
jgi:hypothetical protein